jgi:MFS family permease/predicted enzyme related to lactoylglutathione lyase
MSLPSQYLNNGEILSPRAWGMLLVLCGALFLDAMDISMVGVALPSIREDLGMSTSSLQWVVSGYVLGYGGFLLLGGRAADLFGRRRMFLISLAVFLVASGIGGLVNDGSLLIATRFIKGVSAAFTAPAGLSIITTSFAEGPARNRALLVYTAAGATGFSLGLVFSGLLTELSWRWTLLLPVPLSLLTLLAAIRLVPDSGRQARSNRSFDLPGALTLTAAMLLLVFTIVEAPQAGWTSTRTLGSFATVVAVLSAFVAIELRSVSPLLRLGILRSSSLVRANLGALALQGSWIGFQFIAVLYMQQLRGWSALETGLAIFPGGLMVALLAPTVTPRLVGRFGVVPVILAGTLSAVAAYALFLPIGMNSSYASAMLPTIMLAGIAFALAYGPLNIAATNGVAAEEQGLAGGLVNTSFQIGGALFLAIAVAVNDANAGADGSPQALLDGFHAALIVPVIAAAVGAAATAAGLFRRAAPAKTAEVVPATAPSPAPAVTGLTSATIWSEDHNNLLPFYRDVLGLRVAREAPGRVTLGNGIGPSLSLGTHGDVKGKSSDPYRYQVALGSEDLDADLLRLQAAGVEFFDGEDLNDGIRLVTVKDPDGNLIQLQDGGERNVVASTP